MSLRAVLVDDERLARVVLRDLLTGFPDVEVVAEANSVDAAVRVLETTEPDLIFLDVQMPGGAGTELFERTDVRARVVFVTAYDHYAVRAFELHALDYLLKPVEPERLAVAIDRARQAAGVDPVEEAPVSSPLEADELLCLPHRGGMRFFRVHEVTHLSAADDYCDVHLVDGTTLLSSTPLKRWDEHLPDGFLRVHRSHVVQAGQVREIVPDGSSYRVRLENGAEVPMSRRRGAALLAKLGANKIG